MPETARTPLYDEHIRLGARMTPFGGWEMPLLYRGIIPEHLYTRAKVSIFDICHMGEFEISGPAAEADLEKLLTQSVASIPEGACAYGYLLNEEGGVLDDLICYRFGSEQFWLVVNAGPAASDARWIQDHLSAGTVFRDLSSATAKLDIQGPLAREETEFSLSVKLPELEYYHFCPIELNGVKCVLSRTGYTGEFGYEFYLPADQAGRFWELFLKESAVLPAGLGARDTLRVEMGFPLYGHELNAKSAPAGAARGRKFIDLNKSFIGKEAVLRGIENPSAGVLAGLRLEGRMAARPGDVVFEEEREVGKITSGLFAPSLNAAVALGFIERRFASAGRKLNIKSRGRSLPAEVVKLPFYKQGTARQN